MVVDGQLGLDVGDQPLERARLGLARAGAAGEVGVERPPAAGPAEREVAVEVDAARVLARAVADAVGVRGLHQPQLHAGRRLEPAQPRDRRRGPAVSLPWIEPTTSSRSRRRRIAAARRRCSGRRSDGLSERRGARRAAGASSAIRNARRTARTTPQVVSRRGVAACGCHPERGRPGLGPAGLRYLPAHAQRGDRRSGRVRGLARVVARARRCGGDARRPVRARRPAHHLGRRVAPDPLRPRPGRRLHGLGAARADALARARGRVRRGAADRVRTDAGSPTARTAGRRRRSRRFEAQGIPYERLAPEAGARLFPSYSPAGVAFLLHEPEAGVLRAQRAVRALARQAVAHGAQLVRGRGGPDGAAARLDDGRVLEADVVVWACGAWLGRLFAEHVAIRTTRQELFFFDGGPAWSAPGVPAFVDFEQAIYGTRDIDGLGVKAAPDFDGPALDPDAELPPATARGRGDRAALPRRALPGARARAAARLQVLPLRALARRALRRRAASRAPVRLAARRRLGPRLQARPRARRAGRRGAGRDGAAARALRALRARHGQLPEDGWRGALSGRSVGSMHDYLIVGAGSAGCALAATAHGGPRASACCSWRRARPTRSRPAAHPDGVLPALPHAARLGLQLGAGAGTRRARDLRAARARAGRVARR